jgi:hypothetical protein
MYRKEDGEIYGVLSDYDLPLFFFRKNRGKGQARNSEWEQDRTWRSTSSNLPPRNTCIVTILSGSGKEMANSPLQAWFNLGPTELSIEKLAAQTLYPPPQLKLLEPTSNFEKLHDLSFNIHGLFIDGYGAKLALCGW